MLVGNALKDGEWDGLRLVDDFIVGLPEIDGTPDGLELPRVGGDDPLGAPLKERLGCDDWLGTSDGCIENEISFAVQCSISSAHSPLH